MYRRRFEEDTVEAWRVALKETAAVAGMGNSNVADYSKLILEETKATEDAEPSSIKRNALIYYPNKPPDRNKYTRRVQEAHQLLSSCISYLDDTLVHDLLPPMLAETSK
ncbi:hypothetical protein RJ639_035218 [Escallonia herrerae]|uniref:Uncharacterized protein n=1 Tax=Escallonia herrerae TaxID=1293975 RepID=A0AA88WPY6_9ASTE|nr:hypothetical protein RJ639_035218 [Escallonia herrerae]